MIPPWQFALEEVLVVVIVISGLGFPAWFPWLCDKVRSRFQGSKRP